MKTLLISVFVLVGPLASGCSRPGAADDPKTMDAPSLSSELKRCRDLGLKSYEDANCKAAIQENRERFLGKSRSGST